MSERKLHIAVHPITGRILMGRAKTAGHVATSQTTDITGDVLHAVIQKAARHGGAIEIRSTDGAAYLLTVAKKMGDAQARPTADLAAAAEAVYKLREQDSADLPLQETWPAEFTALGAALDAQKGGA